MNEYQEVYRKHNLSDVVDLKHGYQFRDEDFVEEGIPVIKISNVKGSGLDTKSVTYVDSNRLEEFESVVIKNNDILMSLTGNIGRVVVVSGLKEPVFQNYRVGKFEPLSENLDKGFLACLLSSESLFDQLEQYSNQSAQANFGKQDLDKLKVIIPETIFTQQKIAKILNTVDNLIEKTQTLIDKYTAIKQGMMADLFTRGIDMTTVDTSNSKGGKLRPSVEDAPELYKQTELGWVPKEWEVKLLGDISTIISGITLGNEYSGSDAVEVPYLRVANVQDGYLNLSEIKTVKIPPTHVAKYLLEIGDVLMNEGGDFDKLGRGTIWNGEVEGCCHQNHVFKVRAHRSQLFPEYLAYWSASSFGKSYFIMNSKQSTNLASINSSQLKRFPVLVPSIDEQQVILERLRAIYRW
jgi:type I restriction enzyme S subunit